MSLDFPNAPGSGQPFYTWRWDGIKWAAASSPPASVTVRSDVINVLDYVSSNDTLDCSAGIAAALADGANRTVLFGQPLGGTRVYRVLSRGSAAFTVPNNCRVIGGPLIDFSAIGASGTRKSFFTCSGPGAGSAVVLASDAVEGTFTLALAAGGVATLGLAPGSYVQVSSDLRFPIGYTAGYAGEIARVVSVSGDTLTLYTPLQDNYAVSDGAEAAKWVPYTAHYENMNILGPGRFATGAGDSGLVLNNCVQSSVTGGEIQEVDYNAIRLQNCLSSQVRDTIVRHVPVGDLLVNANVQYGITYLNACQNLLIEANTIYGGKHAIVQSLSDIPGATRFIDIVGNWVYGTWHGAIVTHESAVDLSLRDNHLIGVNLGIDMRVQKVMSSNNEIRSLVDDDVGCGFLLNRCIHEFTSRNDTVEGGRYAYRLPEFAVMLEGAPTTIAIQNALCINQSQTAIDLINTTGAVRSQLSVTDCIFRQQHSTAINIDGPTWNNVVVARNQMFADAPAGGFAVSTSDVTNAVIEDNKWDDNFPSVLFLGGVNIQQRRNGRIASKTGYRPEVATLASQAPLGATTAVGNTSEQILATIALPAGAFSSFGGFTLNYMGTYTNSANAKTWRVRYGAAGAGLTGTVIRQTAATTTASLRDQVALQARTQIEAVYWAVDAPSFGTSSAAALPTLVIAPNTATEIVITAQPASAADTMTLGTYTVQLHSMPDVAVAGLLTLREGPPEVDTWVPDPGSL